MVPSYTLNIKGIPFKTEWVECPDIEPLCLRIGAPPTGKKPDGQPHYTLPVIYDPSTKRAISESAVIAKYLDETYPSTPVLFPQGTDALQAVFAGIAWSTVGSSMFMIIASRECASLNPCSAEYVREAIIARMGKPLEQINGEEYWAALETGLGKVDAWLRANGAGRDELFLGDQICFVDTLLAGLLNWVRILCGEDSVDWKRITGWHGGKWDRIVKNFDIYYGAFDAQG